jgi:hypothetical protein
MVRGSVWEASGTPVASAGRISLLDLARAARGARREQPAPGGLISGVCEAPQDRKVHG